MSDVLAVPALRLVSLPDGKTVIRHIHLPSGGSVIISKKSRRPGSPEPAIDNGIFNTLAVSRRHAEVWEENGKIYIQDLGSFRGTWINGHRLSRRGVESEPYELKTHDVLQLGEDFDELKGREVSKITRVTARVICVFDLSDTLPGAHQNPPPENLSRWKRILRALHLDRRFLGYDGPGAGGEDPPPDIHDVYGTRGPLPDYSAINDFQYDDEETHRSMVSLDGRVLEEAQTFPGGEYTSLPGSWSFLEPPELDGQGHFPHPEIHPQRTTRKRSVLRKRKKSIRRDPDPISHSTHLPYPDEDSVLFSTNPYFVRTPALIPPRSSLPQPPLSSPIQADNKGQKKKKTKKTKAQRSPREHSAQRRSPPSAHNDGYPTAFFPPAFDFYRYGNIPTLTTADTLAIPESEEPWNISKPAAWMLWAPEFSVILFVRCSELRLHIGVWCGCVEIGQRLMRLLVSNMRCNITNYVSRLLCARTQFQSFCDFSAFPSLQIMIFPQ